MRFVTPLRYPGGKAKLWKYIAGLIRANGCMDGHYAEAYAGGAGIALQLLQQEFVRHVHLNDLNQSVYAFWTSVLREPEEFCRRIHHCKLNVNEWKRQREIQRNPAAATIMDLGFSLFYLNRTNRSGIINAGVIGGLEQQGAWKLDARFNREELIQRVKKISQYKHRIHIDNLDAEAFLANKISDLPSNTLYYLDPPYYAKGSRLYDNFYEHDDHARLGQFVSSRMKKCKWLVSYDNVANIREIYKQFDQQQYGLNYSAREYRLGSEIMIFGPKLVVGNLDTKLLRPPTHLQGNA